MTDLLCDGPSPSSASQRVFLRWEQKDHWPTSTHMDHRPHSEYSDGGGPPARWQKSPKSPLDPRIRLFPPPPGTDNTRKQYERQGGSGHVPRPPSVLTQHNRRRRGPGREPRLSPRAAVAPWTAKERDNKRKSTGGVRATGASGQQERFWTAHDPPTDDESAIIPHHLSSSTDGYSTSESSDHHRTRSSLSDHCIKDTSFLWSDSEDEPSEESDDGRSFVQPSRSVSLHRKGPDRPHSPSTSHGTRPTSGTPEALRMHPGTPVKPGTGVWAPTHDSHLHGAGGRRGSRHESFGDERLTHSHLHSDEDSLTALRPMPHHASHHKETPTSPLDKARAEVKKDPSRYRARSARSAHEKRRRLWIIAGCIAVRSRVFHVLQLPRTGFGADSHAGADSFAL